MPNNGKEQDVFIRTVLSNPQVTVMRMVNRGILIGDALRYKAPTFFSLMRRGYFEFTEGKKPEDGVWTLSDKGQKTLDAFLRGNPGDCLVMHNTEQRENRVVDRWQEILSKHIRAF